MLELKTMSDMSNLYRAYSAVHSSEISDQLKESRDIISDMEFNQMNSADLQEVAEEIIEEMFVNTLTVKQSKEIVEQIINEALNGEQSELRSSKVEYIKESFDRAFYNCHTEERFTTYRHSKKVQENFHNISNEELGNKRLHEALIAQEKKTIKEGILSLIEKKTKDSSYLETNMEKRLENNEKARKDMENMGTTMKNPQLEEFSQIRQDWSSAYSSIYEPEGDEVNEEDKPTTPQLKAREKYARIKELTNKGKHQEASKLYNAKEEFKALTPDDKDRIRNQAERRKRSADRAQNASDYETSTKQDQQVRKMKSVLNNEVENEFVNKLIESGQFSEEEIVRIIEASAD